MTLVMRWLTQLWRALRRLFKRVRFWKATAPLGIFGAPNAGKSSLANVFCEDWAGERLSSVSPVPHETREVHRKDRLLLTDGKDELVVDVLDTPGLASRVTTAELEKLHGMTKKEAEERAKDAIQGMLDAIKALERVEGILLVVDATRDPAEQVNEVLLAHAKAKSVPLIVVANKIDLPNADAKAVEKAFGGAFPVVPISAKTRQNVQALYKTMYRTFDP